MMSHTFLFSLPPTVHPPPTRSATHGDASPRCDQAHVMLPSVFFDLLPQGSSVVVQQRPISLTSILSPKDFELNWNWLLGGCLGGCLGGLLSESRRDRDTGRRWIPRPS